MNNRPLPTSWIKRSIRRSESEGGQDLHQWGIIAEVAVEIGFNGKPAAVMMASPSDVEDFAIGFSLTEEILIDTSAVERIEIKAFPEGLTVNIIAPASALNASKLRHRLLEGRTGCGLCGVETLAAAMRRPSQHGSTLEINDDAILRAFSHMANHQPLQKATRSAHAAAFAAADGKIGLLREDVGRHNALDKLVGARAREGLDMSAGFVVMSSRCSFELVQKAAMAGAPLIATVSAPTTAALDLAALVEVTVCCLDVGKLVRFEKAD